MSRYIIRIDKYQYEVFVKHAKHKKVREILENMGEEAQDYSYKKSIIFGGDTTLTGGESEQEAHSRISEAIKKVFPKAKVRTKWTFMEDLPYQEYGDDF